MVFFGSSTLFVTHDTSRLRTKYYMVPRDFEDTIFKYATSNTTNI